MANTSPTFPKPQYKIKCLIGYFYNVPGDERIKR